MIAVLALDRDARDIEAENSSNGANPHPYSRHFARHLRGIDLGYEVIDRGLFLRRRVHFSHCIRYELYGKLNPIASVRQSAVQQRDPDILTLSEMRAILLNIEPPAIKIMVATAAAPALRRSEFRGLKWEDLDLDNCWFHCRRGLVGEYETKMKTRASRKSVEMNPTLAEALRAWRELTPYPQDTDWVFASQFTSGRRPSWPDSALKDHVRQAATKAGITKIYRMAHVPALPGDPLGPPGRRHQGRPGAAAPCII